MARQATDDNTTQRGKYGMARQATDDNTIQRGKYGMARQYDTARKICELRTGELRQQYRHNLIIFNTYHCYQQYEILRNSTTAAKGTHCCSSPSTLDTLHF